MACQRPTEKPRPGKSASNIRSGYFILGCGSHNIFFREEKSRIVVVRILHNRMDFKRHL
jgi:toxin ParE1/3/4